MQTSASQRHFCFRITEATHILLLAVILADEEVGGHDGMETFVFTQKFKSLRPGLVLDEGLRAAPLPLTHGTDHHHPMCL